MTTSDASAAIVYFTFIAIDATSGGQRDLATELALAAVAAILIHRIASRRGR